MPELQVEVIYLDGSVLLHVPVAVIDTLTFALFFKRFLGEKHNTLRPYILAYSAYLILNVILSTLYPDILPAYSVISCLVIPYVLYSGARMQRVFCGGLLTAYLFVSEILTMLALSFVIRRTMPEIAGNAFFYYTGAFISKAVSLVLALVISRNRKSAFVLAPSYYNWLLLAIIYICVGLSYFDLKLVKQSGSHAAGFHVLSVFAIFVLSILVFFVFKKFQEYAEREAYTAIVEQHLQEDECRFRLIASQDKEILGIKHELVNHLTSIRGLSANKQYGQLNDYLDEYIRETTGVLSRSITGMPSIDALLSEKIAVAESEGAEFSASIGALPELLISPVHLNMILGNALDNAVEACRKLPDGMRRYISLCIEAEGDWLYVRIANSSLQVKIGAGGLPGSDKGDRLRHGLGLNIAKRLIERYEGAMHCECGGGEFAFLAQMRQTPVDGAS